VKSSNVQSAMPNEGIRFSARNGLHEGLVFGLVCAFVFGLAIVVRRLTNEQIYKPVSVLELALVSYLGFGLGLLTGLRGGLGEAFKHYVLRMFLWSEGKLPLKLVPWLESCRARLLFRRQGGAYMFWHVTLQDYFAELDDTRLAELAQRIESRPRYVQSY
jgi:hypothetical protein